jgi:hypothetical protein
MPFGLLMSHSSVILRLHVTNASPRRRRGEPVTCGIPWPRGFLKNPKDLCLQDQDGRAVPLQTAILDSWPDRSVRWLLLDWQAEFSGQAQYTLCWANPSNSIPHSPGLQVDQFPSGMLHCKTGTGSFQITVSEQDALWTYQPTDAPSESSIHLHMVAEDSKGIPYTARTQRLTIEDSGPLRQVVLLQGTFRAEKRSEPLAEWFMRLHFFWNQAIVRTHVTIRNPRKAGHPGGLWDLGNAGSIYLRDLTLRLVRSQPVGIGEFEGAISPEIDAPYLPFHHQCELYQDSSGGENWQSSNHLNRNRQVPHTFRGYRLRLDEIDTSGLRATPVVTVQGKEHALGFAMPAFWQNFPKSLEVDQRGLICRLFPQQFGNVHEIQGGEQKTHTCYFALGPDQVSEQPLAWCRQPAHVLAEPAWYCQSQAVPFLTSQADDPHNGYLQLVDAAVQGNDTFERKRECIDEYGWRHFGDLYGDHEAVRHTGPTPLVSHYNNQYDAIAGMGYQYLRSGDPRWFAMMGELAYHVADIDVYHTNQDKSAYNHGLFWHTYHYVDADTGNHRSYPGHVRLPPDAHPLPGGGPANEHNYTSGLMLHYFLTGDRLTRSTALELAEWVLGMEDGSKTPFRWLSLADTGLASKSKTTDYHGPGRGAANSISALLDGHHLTGEARFLAKAQELIRRCIHPEDDLAERHLLDRENRWFYTMFLQVLGKFLWYKAEREELDEAYAYAWASLLHYANWMADHEFPYLSKPELLEYPTETWAAQDLRKYEIFQFAALCTQGEARDRFEERAEYFFRTSVESLLALPTRSLCRPLVLLLNYGFSRAWRKSHPDAQLPSPKFTPVSSFGPPTRFIPQKALAVRRAKRLVLIGGALLGVLALFIIGYSWWA